MPTQDASKVLFICTGNYYRSRLAEILFNHYSQLHRHPFRAQSRGFVEQSNCRGVAREVLDYLQQRNIPLREEIQRDPLVLKIEDLEQADLIIGMSRDEHYPMLKSRFPGILRILEQEGRIRFWNIDDVPGRVGFWVKIFSMNLPSQRAASSAEHIDFAVRVLLSELANQVPMTKLQPEFAKHADITATANQNTPSSRGSITCGDPEHELSQTLRLSVLLCTYNPSKEVLQRVLTSLHRQTLPKRYWEFILVDNNSTPSLDESLATVAHPTGKLLRETEQGLTPARLCGFQSARADIAVLVDDDTVLDEDYLEMVLRVADTHRTVAVGCGQRRAEFLEPVPTNLLPHTGILAIGEFSKSWWSNYDPSPSRLPVGAGMWLRRIIWEEYIKRLQREPWRRKLDRTAASLTSCGDHDIALLAHSLGWGTGQFTELKLTHVIAPGRTTLSYLKRLREAISESSALLNYYYFGEIPQNTLWRGLKNWITLMRLDSISREMMRAHLRGLKTAEKKIRSMQPTATSQ